MQRHDEELSAYERIRRLLARLDPRSAIGFLPMAGAIPPAPPPARPFFSGVTTELKYTNAASVASIAALGVRIVRLQAHNAAVEASSQLVNTTSATAITGTGSQVVTPLDMTNITVGQQLFLYGGTGSPQNSETVTVTAVTGTTFTAPFTQAHSGAYVISGESFDWTALDAAMALYQAAGLSMVLTLEGFAPWWLDSNGLPTGYAMQMWGQQLLARYGVGYNLIRIEQGNEEFSFVSGAARDASVYYAVVSVSYPYLKALAGSIQVGCFGFTNYSGSAGNNGDPGYWFLQFCLLGGGAFVDCFQFHYYNSSISPLLPNPGGAPALLFIVAAINSAPNTVGLNKPVIIGEMGWQGKPSFGNVTCPNNIGPVAQADNLILAYNLLRAAPNVSEAIFYTNGAIEAGFYDCHDLDGLSSYTAMQEYFATI